MYPVPLLAETFSEFPTFHLESGAEDTISMLRRMLYINGLGPFQPYMNAALLGAVILASGYLVFLVNIMRTVGFKTILSIFYAPHKPSMIVQAVTEPSSRTLGIWDL